jgi:hypothetical protein
MTYKIINWIKRVYKFFEDLFYDLFYDHKDGINAPMTFSIGRTAFVVWFFITANKTWNGVPLNYFWYVLGISLLSYVIGKNYIVTSLGMGSQQDNSKEHP